MVEPSNRAAYGAVIERCFDLAKPSSLYFGALGATASLVELNTVSPTFSAPMPYDDAFVLIIRLKAGVPLQFWIDGKFTPSGALAAGSSSVLDQRSSPYCLGFGACRHVQFHLPRPQLNALALDEGFAPIGEIDHRTGFARHDPVLASLAALFEPVLRGDPEPADHLMTSYLAVAVASRFISQRSQRLNVSKPSTPLSLAQLSMVKEHLTATLGGDTSVFELAAMCGLPVRMFIRAFRAAVGTSPHMWVLRRRLDLAIDLIHRPGLDLSRVAVASGFGDVHRMEAGFLKMLGHPPVVFQDPAAASRYRRH